MDISSLHTATADGRNGRFTGLQSDTLVFGAYRQQGIWSEDVTHFFTSWFDKWQAGGRKGSYLDIGANIGLTLIPLTAHNAVSHCLGVEADPINAALLRHNLSQNEAGHVPVVQAAVFDANTQLQFERDPVNAGDHRVRQNPRADAISMMDEARRETVTVLATTLDDIVAQQNLPGPLAIKVDIQGAEPALFRGGRETLRNAEVMLIEYWPYGLARMGEDEAAFRAQISAQFSHGALIWPHAPTDPPHWCALTDVFDEIDAVFGGGDTELHKIGCLNLALTDRPV